MQDKHVYSALDQKFNTDPTPVNEKRPVAVQTDPGTELVDDDFDQARAALKDMIKKGQDAVDGIMSIARQSDHPRAFEVTGQLIKTVSDTAKDLLALQKQKKELSTVAPGAEAPKQIGTQNNIVFSGSTTDLIKMLRQQDEKIINADTSTSEEN